mgnify:FL=1|tara:strand:+ start:1354 stop:1809 length:456 start_codon:yes stop_codon:yes gene_type:complete
MATLSSKVTPSGVATAAQGALADSALQPTGDGSALTGIGVTSALSSGQTISSAGTVTVAHGLGVQPTKVWAYIQCTTADNGYSVGDKLYTAYAVRDTSANRSQGFSLVVDATNWVVRFADYTTPIASVVKSTGAATYLTNANWQLYLGAET